MSSKIGSTIISIILATVVINLVLLGCRSHAFIDVGDNVVMHQGGMCPEANIIVSKDGLGNYETINHALSHVPHYSHGRFIIYVKQGTYNEQIFISDKMWSVTLCGDGPMRTKITANESKGGMSSKIETRDTATVVVQGKNFIARDIGIENSAGPEMHQALALLVEAEQSVFYNCRIDGYQDTLSPNKGSQFYRDCAISGTVDFIFGDGKVVFQNCTLQVRKPLQDQLCMVTAQGRAIANGDTGFVMQNCRIVPAPDYPTKDKYFRTFLGRPWRPFARTVVLDSYLDSIIDPMGWSDWNTTTNYLNTCWFREFGSHGPGGNTTQRIKSPGVKPMSQIFAAQFTPIRFFGDDQWILRSLVPYNPSWI